MVYDVLIIGGGPAGLTAAVYARRAEKSVLILEKNNVGGQITFSPNAENIAGFPQISGNEFAEKLTEQALRQGAEFEFCEVLRLRAEDKRYVAETDAGTFSGKSVILATGTAHRTLHLPREEKFIGNGISFCAVCDGAFYKNKTVVLIGGGNTALQEALFLSRLVQKLYVVQNLDHFTGEEKLQKELAEKDNVEILFGATAEGYLGENTLTGVRVKTKEGVREISADGVFLAVGLVPQNAAFGENVALTSEGYVDADESCVTSAAGIFAAGDCRRKKIRQVETAVADGAVAALAACDYLHSL